jgi:predicted transcriptional regulator
MNILITLPKHLIDKILSGEKKYEMRKCLPKHMKIGEDGFFVVEKGTDDVRCWCRVDEVRETYIDHYSAGWFAPRLCVSEEYIEKYANSKKVYLWKIGKVVKLQDLCRDSLYVDKNPQSFAYCPLSYGESY